MPDAARIGDRHTCRYHATGVIKQGSATVSIGYRPAARAGDEVVCFKSRNRIAQGEPTVFIEGKMAARKDDKTEHKGAISSGCMTVSIGSTPQMETLKTAAQRGVPFCEECEDKGLTEPTGAEPQEP